MTVVHNLAENDLQNLLLVNTKLQVTVLMECLLLEVKTTNSQLLRITTHLDLMMLSRKQKMMLVTKSRCATASAKSHCKIVRADE